VQICGATNPALGIISDIDDTLTDTGVTRKVEVLKNTFFEDTYNVKIFPDAPRAILSIAGKGADLLPTLPVFYLSGSPWGLHERISDAFDRSGFPHGAMILRRYSQESLNPFDFKYPHLIEIVDANPGRKWILFGDTGEKDPEIYHALKKDRPGAVAEVFIHNVTNADPKDKRFDEFTLFREWAEVVLAIRDRKLGAAAAASGA
jgi:phosphatidate phosphatase APP1